MGFVVVGWALSPKRQVWFLPIHLPDKSSSLALPSYPSVTQRINLLENPKLPAFHSDFLIVFYTLSHYFLFSLNLQCRRPRLIGGVLVCGRGWNWMGFEVSSKPFYDGIILVNVMQSLVLCYTSSWLALCASEAEGKQNVSRSNSDYNTSILSGCLQVYGKITQPSVKALLIL